MLIRLAELDLPCPPERLFGRSAPLGLDVGFGDGRFLAAMASERPDWNWLGAEMSATYVLRALRALRLGGFEHVRLLHAPGGFAVRDVLPSASLSEVFVNFPDPWPKSRHQPRRLLQAPLLAVLSHRLVVGGRILLTTDHEDYFRFVLDEAETTGLYRVEIGDPPAAVLGTKYAAKWQRVGRPIHHVALVLRDRAPTVPARLERCDMPHAILSGDLPREFPFETQVREVATGRVVIVEALRSVSADGLAFLAHVREEDLEQQVIVEARTHADGVIVRLRRFGDPLITHGVKESVGCVADFLATLGLVVLRRVY